MDKPQADAVARALLAPGLHAQKEVRRQKAVAARLMAKKRQAAWCAIAGSTIGVIAALFIGQRLIFGAVWGGSVSAGLAWIILGLRDGSHAS
jgi:hypothetical protein